jgi:hypothetical protein
LPERLHDVQVCEAPEQLLSGSLDWRQPSLLLLYMFTYFFFTYTFHRKSKSKIENQTHSMRYQIKSMGKKAEKKGT